jgi:hypothetical protein
VASNRSNNSNIKEGKIFDLATALMGSQGCLCSLLLWRRSPSYTAFLLCGVNFKLAVTTEGSTYQIKIYKY